MQEMHGLNWIDNLARFRTVSDGGGFTGVDPLSEARPWLSPYMWCSGNPVNRTDPSGLYDLPELTVTAPAPKDNNNYNLLFQQLNEQANRNTTQIPRITPPTPVFNLPTNQNAGKIVNFKNIEEKKNSTLDDISLALSAVGISADGAHIFTTDNAGNKIIYVTLKGTTAAANTTKVLAALKGISNATIVVGIALDLGRAAIEPEYRGKAIANTGVAVVSAIIGGVPGLVIGGSYLILDQIGAFDTPDNLPLYQSPITPQDNTKVTLPFNKH